MIRSFVAIDLPQTARQALRDVADRLRSAVAADSIRWTRIPGIHLTLKFLGNVAEEDVDAIKAALSEVGQRHAPFNFTIAGVGCFPNAKRPQVAWVGVQEEKGALAALQRDVEECLVPLGFQAEKRAFHPHLTLGRTRRYVSRHEQRRLGEVIANIQVGELARIQVESFRLMRSDLRPDGAVYTPLAVFSLGLEQETG